MKTRSQTNALRQATVAVQTPVAKAQSEAETEDDTKMCPICYDPLDSRNTVLIHKGAQWQHIIHVDCHDKWVHICKQNNNQPTCPMCPNFKIVEQTKYMKRALDHLDIIKEVNGDLPYIGIMIYMGGSCVLKLTNLDFHSFICEQNIDTPLNVICKATRNMGPNVCREIGILSPKNIPHNINPLNWLNWKYPTLRVKKTYFAVPPRGIGPNIDADIRMDRTLGEIYVDYIAYIYGIYDTILRSADSYEHVKNVFQPITRSTMGGDIYIEGYENPENPEFPIQYWACTDRPKSTHVPMAWIAIDTEYK